MHSDRRRQKIRACGRCHGHVKALPKTDIPWVLRPIADVRVRVVRPCPGRNPEWIVRHDRSSWAPDVVTRASDVLAAMGTMSAVPACIRVQSFVIAHDRLTYQAAHRWSPMLYGHSDMKRYCPMIIAVVISIIICVTLLGYRHLQQERMQPQVSSEF